MDTIDLTIIDPDDRVTVVPASVDGQRVLLGTDALATGVGWVLKPEGLCRDDACIPTRGRPGLVESADRGDLVDIAAFAALIREPLVIDAGAGVAAYGASAADRTERLWSLDAPDFAVGNLDGESVALADFRGRKKLLVAFASW